MLKWIIFVFLLSFFTSAQFNYIDKNSQARETTNIQSYLRNRLEFGSFDRFYQNHYSSYQYVDQALIHGQRKVFIKSGLEAPKKYLNKFITYKGGLLYHARVHSHHIAIYSLNTSKSDILTLLKKIEKEIPRKKVTLIDLVIPQAHAQQRVEDCYQGNFDIGGAPVAVIAQTTSKLSADYLMTQSRACIQTVLTGAWNTAGDMATGFGKGVQSFFSSPLKSMGKFWDGAVEMVKSTAAFLGNIKSEVTELVDTISSLDRETQVQLICQLVGSIGGATLIGVLTRGALGLSQALVKFVSQSKKVKELIGVIKTFASLKKSLPEGVEVKDLMGKILTSTKTKVIEKLKTLSNLKMPKLAQRYALCAL